MEFWLNVLELFYSPGDLVNCLFGGSKTMHVANVSLPQISLSLFHLINNI
jgi:hypothetical protein